MGFNPWKSRLELWEQKVLGWEDQQDPAAIRRMEEGQRLEPIARKAYIDYMGIVVTPMVVESDEYPMLSASLDGITLDLSRAVEIKCGASSHRSARDNLIPAYYICQLQHQMLVTGLQSIDYFSYTPDECICLNVKRDDEFIQELLEKELEFWHHMQAGIPPEN
jgi:putative phage-type endonuclease